MKAEEGRQEGEEQTTGATPPEIKLNLDKGTQSGDQPGKQKPDAPRPTEKSATGQIPDFAAAGHGNQVQDNETREESSPVPHIQDDLKAGAQPDGAATISERRLPNEDIERPDQYLNDFWREQEGYGKEER